MHSGDLATIDGEGYVNIVGRIKEMVIRGGEDLYPREIKLPTTVAGKFQKFCMREIAVAELGLEGEIRAAA